MTFGVDRETAITTALSKVGQYAPYNGPNCFAAAFSEFDIQMSSEEALYLLATEWRQISREDLKPGDLVRYGTTHMAMYLGDGMAFHKPNWHRSSPYLVQPLDRIVQESELYHRSISGGGPESPQVLQMVESLATYYTPNTEPAMFLDAEYPMCDARTSLLQYGILRFADAIGVGQLAGPGTTLFSEFVFMIPLYETVRMFLGEAELSNLFGYSAETARAYVHFISLSKQLESLMKEFGRMMDDPGIVDFVIDGFKNPPASFHNDIAVVLSMMGVPARYLDTAASKVERKMMRVNSGVWKWLVNTFRPSAKRDVFLPSMRVAFSYAGDIPLEPFDGATVLEPADMLKGPKEITDLLGGSSAYPPSLRSYSQDVLLRTERGLMLDHERLGEDVFPRIEKITAAVERSKAAMKMRDLKL